MMNYRYGLEIESFYNPVGINITDIAIPPKDFPVDGFPGLVELRTTGHHTLEGAFADIYKEELNLPDGSLVYISEYTFSPTEKRELRKRHWVKDICDIQNLYGKKPRNLRGKTIASFQINISNLDRSSYRDDKNVFHPDCFTLLCVPRIVRALDKEFEVEIKESKRQAGEYCIKGDRLEYRSLPNTVYKGIEFGVSVNIKKLIKRIRKAVEG